MTPADLRAWIRRSRSAQGLPPRPTPQAIARVVAVLARRSEGATNGKAAK